jgi:hypothetical protein
MNANTEPTGDFIANAEHLGKLDQKLNNSLPRHVKKT